MSGEAAVTAAEPAPVRLPAATADTSAADRVWSVLAVLPEFAGAALAAYAVVAMCLVLAGHYRAAIALPIGGAAALVAGVAAAVACWPVADRRPARRVADLLVLLGGVAFAGVDAKYASQDLLAFRDPTTYNVTGQWLSRHGSALVDTNAHVFGTVAKLEYQSPGFRSTLGGHLYPQGNHLLPALLAVGGWIGGPALLLRTDALIGGIALLITYGLLRRLAHPLFAAASVASLAVSLPMIEFARDTYTEVTELALMSAALLLVWAAVDRRRTHLFFLAGLAFGGVSLAHVDSVFTQLILVVFIAIMLAMAPVGGRGRALRHAAALAAGDAAALVLSLLDLHWNSPLYLHDLHTFVHPVTVGAYVLVPLAAVAVAVVWGVRPLRSGLARLAHTVATPAAVLVVVGFAVLGSRPWWLYAHKQPPNEYVVILQKAEHLHVDALASYAQLSLNWIGWYLGWVAVGLGVLGTAYLVWLLLRRGDLPLLAFLLVYLGTAVLYLNRPNIVPDQVWADRHLLWAVYPGVLAGAAVALTRLAGWSRRAVPVAAVLALLVAGLPLVTTLPVFKIRYGPPLLAQTQAVCRAVGPTGAIVVIGADIRNPDGYLAALRAYCDVPVTEVGPTDRGTLAALQRTVAAHGRTLYAESGDATLFGSVTASVPLVFSRVFWTYWNARLSGPVNSGGGQIHSVFLGRVQPDGSVALLAVRGPVQLGVPG